MMKAIDKYLRPHYYTDNLLLVDFERFFSEGFRLVLVDVDNTLSRHGSKIADAYARKVIAAIQAAGLSCMIVSNAGLRRIRAYAADMGLPYHARSHKPLTKALDLAFRQHAVRPEQALMIGDQILTDILAGNRAGCRTILVKPRDQRESWGILIKRFFEKFLLRRFKLK